MSEILSWQRENGTMILLPKRGRVLQVNIQGHDAFWINEQFENDSGDWNAGGDRLWVAPERDWFWKSHSSMDFGDYDISSHLDPGSWTKEVANHNYCCVRQRVALKNWRGGEYAEFSLARGIQLIEYPGAPFFESYLSYRTDNELELVRGPSGQNLDIWSILQIPPGGNLLVGTRGDVNLRDYFDPIPSTLWKKDSQSLQLKITGDTRYKIGVAPEQSTGRMAYARRIDGRYLVIYRQFFAQPWQRYCDTPGLDTASQGDAVQVYNDSGAFGGFGEMEFHSPAITFGSGPQRLADSNLTIVGFVAEQDWLPWQEFWLYGNET